MHGSWPHLEQCLWSRSPLPLRMPPSYPLLHLLLNAGSGHILVAGLFADTSTATNLWPNSMWVTCLGGFLLAFVSFPVFPAFICKPMTKLFVFFTHCFTERLKAGATVQLHSHTHGYTQNCFAENNLYPNDRPIVNTLSHASSNDRQKRSHVTWHRSHASLGNQWEHTLIIGHVVSREGARLDETMLQLLKIEPVYLYLRPSLRCIFLCVL